MECSFCGKKSHEVDLLIKNEDVCICDECVKKCNEIILERKIYHIAKQIIEEKS